MPTYPVRDWFIPGEGIKREVIAADIQSYLGNDATARPGKGKENGVEVRDGKPGAPNAID